MKSMKTSKNKNGKISAEKKIKQSKTNISEETNENEKTNVSKKTNKNISEDELVKNKIEAAKTYRDLIISDKLRGINKIIIDIIKKYNCIVYGGTAMHYHILNKQKELGLEPVGIYSKDKVFDYDVMHWNYVELGVIFANEMNKAGYKYIKCNRNLYINL
jgi:hypothetical protein